MKTGPRVVEVYEPRQARKGAAVSKILACPGCSWSELAIQIAPGEKDQKWVHDQF